MATAARGAITASLNRTSFEVAELALDFALQSLQSRHQSCIHRVSERACSCVNTQCCCRNCSWRPKGLGLNAKISLNDDGYCPKRNGSCPTVTHTLRNLRNKRHRLETTCFYKYESKFRDYQNRFEYDTTNPRMLPASSLLANLFKHRRLERAERIRSPSFRRISIRVGVRQKCPVVVPACARMHNR